MSKGFVCERCKRRDIWITFVCENCHKHVCQNCIVFLTFMPPHPMGIPLRIEDADIENKQLCLDCAYPKEGVRINEPEPVLA